MLTGEVGGRRLFSDHPIQQVPWEDAAILLDVDTPTDYDHLLDLDSKG
jgi:CTP:molybdopterin cytidylyltransferase MocA